MIIVVGAGLTGSCLSRALNRQGKRHVVVAPVTKPHSLAALAVVRRGYHKPAERGLVDESLGLLSLWGAIAGTGAQVSNYRVPGKVRLDNDWTLVDPAAPLVKPDVPGYVTEVSERGVVLADGKYLRGKPVICPGAGSSLAPDGWKTSHGYTWINDDPSVLNLETAPLRVHHSAPYKSIVAGIVRGQVRLGSSSAATQSAARDQADKMLHQAVSAGMISSSSGWRAEYGLRAQGDCRTLNGVTVLGGFHRTGYATVPAFTARLAATL